MLKLPTKINLEKLSEKKAIKKACKGFDQAVAENNQLSKGHTLPIVQFMIDILYYDEYRKWAGIENKKNKIWTPPASINQLHAVCVGIKYGDYQMQKYDFHRMNSRIGPPMVGYFPIEASTNAIVRTVISYWLDESHKNNSVCHLSPPSNNANHANDGCIAPMVRDFRMPNHLYKKHYISRVY